MIKFLTDTFKIFRNRPSHKIVGVDFFPHYFMIESQEQEENILKYNPQGSGIRRSEFIIDHLKINRFLSGVLEGNPSDLVWGEIAEPLVNQCLGAKSEEDVNKRLEGFQYQAPVVFYGPLDEYFGHSYQQIFKWKYTIDLLSKDRELTLRFVFRVPELLSEQELKVYIAKHADWSLAQEYML